jgi:acyl-ACP thioesterase
MDAPIVTRNLEICSYEVDPNSLLKPVALQNLLQEIGYEGSEFCKCGYELLRSRNLFWALNRIHFRIPETPRWGDKIVLQTWSRGQAGPLWHRNFRMVRPDQPEKPLVLATSAWTVVDLSQRTLFRGDLGFDESYHYGMDTLPFCTKITVPRDLEQSNAGSHAVVWSDLDSNGHANNCVYTQWAIDLMPYEYVRNHRVSDVEINYFHEIRPGSTVDFLLARSENRWYVTGKVGDTVCFIERIEFD